MRDNLNLKTLLFLSMIMAMVSCNKAKLLTEESNTQTVKPYSLVGSIVELSPDFPHGLVIDDKVSTGSNSEHYRKIVQGRNGEIYLLSEVKHNNSESDFVQYGHISRILFDGTKDLTFGTSGNFRVHSDYGNKEHYYDMSMDANGKLVIAGHNWHIAQQSYHSASVKVDVSGNGAYDTTYGTNGFQRTKILKYTYTSRNLILRDGSSIRIAFSNNTTTTGPYQVALIKVDSNGVLDTSFGTNGIASLGLTSYYLEGYNNLFEDSDGNIYLLMLEGLASYNEVIYKYDPSGALVTDFGVNGKFVFRNDVSTYNVYSQMHNDEIISNMQFYSNSVWSGVNYNLNIETGSVNSELLHSDISLPGDRICTSLGKLAYYKKKMLSQCYIGAESKAGIIVINEDLSIDETFGVDGFLEITTVGDFFPELLVDEARKVLWLGGSRKISNDTQKYIIKINLSEVYE